MSKLIEMIKGLCSDEIVYDSICNVTELTAGDRITKSDMSDDQEYPAMGAGVVPTGYYKDWNREHCVTISRAGAGAGSIGWQAGKFWATDVCFVAAQKRDGPLIKYVYYAMKSKEKELKTHIYGGSMPKIDKTYLWKMSIPIPTREIQEEIIQILEEYEEKNRCLISEMNAELESRKKQFEYYQDTLLSFDVSKKGDYDEHDQQRISVEWLTLDAISENCDAQRKPVTKRDRKAGRYPYYGASGVVDYVDQYIYDGDYLLISEDGANLIARVTPIAFPVSGKCWVNNHAHVIRFDKMITQKYVELYLNYIDLKPFVTSAAQPKLSQNSLYKIKIPVPSISDQTIIVNQLSRLEKAYQELVSLINEEIDLRNKQYDYYRDELLSFREVS